MSNNALRKLQEQAALEAQREADRRAYRNALQCADLEESNVRYCGENSGDFSNREWAEQIARFLTAARDVSEWWSRFEKLRPKDDESAWTVALSIYQLCNKGEIDAAVNLLDECDALGKSWARAGITFALKQALPDAIAKAPIQLDSNPSVTFHSLAFELLGIEGLPLPRYNWHLKVGQDGFDDPYLDDQDYQKLCNIVCERVSGMTVQCWRESTKGQRIALMEVAIQRGEEPRKNRLHIEDIDSFAEVRKITLGAVAILLEGGLLQIDENSVKTAIEEILNVPFHRNDRPDELDDIYTSNVIVDGVRRPTAFMLKGPGIRKKEMTIAHCGKNGDQLVRLFDAPADLFVVQFIGRIAETVIKDVEGKVDALHKRGKRVQFLILEGQDTARLLLAYGKLPSV